MYAVEECSTTTCRCHHYTPEEVGYIFCTRDYALCLNGNNCVFYVPNYTTPASFPSQHGLAGTEGNRKLPTRSEATVGSLKGRSMLKTLQVGKASG